jgi:hypothetical protein
VLTGTVLTGPSSSRLPDRSPDAEQSQPGGVGEHPQRECCGGFGGTAAKGPSSVVRHIEVSTLISAAHQGGYPH